MPNHALGQAGKAVQRHLCQAQTAGFYLSFSYVQN